MPKKVLQNSKEMHLWYEKMRKNLGFHLASKSEKINWIKNKIQIEKFNSFHNKSIKKGLEDCLVYKNNGKEVHVWTSFVPEEGAMRDSDFIWVYILDRLFPEKPCLFTIPIRRTLNALNRTYKRARALKNLVDNWQTCTIHKIDLRIVLVKKDKMHASSYVCPGYGYHKGIPRSIYTGMLNEERSILEKSFFSYDLYKKREIEKGRNPIPQRILRSIRTNREGYLNIFQPDFYPDRENNDVEYNDGDHLQ